MASERALHGALERGLSALTVGMAQSQDDFEASLLATEASDMSQVVQLHASGIAQTEPVWTEGEVQLPYPFIQHIDDTQTDSGLAMPHFASGVELQSDGFVLLDAQVRTWIYSEEGWITGARVRVAAWAPGGAGVQYVAVVHLTFTGFAAPSDDESES